MGKLVTVGIADLNVVRSPDSLVTYALGSCVGICLYDSGTKIAGLAHIMLPSSKGAAQTPGSRRRFADTGIDELVRLMRAEGASVRGLTAKIAGGAQMFRGSSDVFNIGERNVEAVKKILADWEIRIIAEETGADFGRTVFFHSETGLMEVRTAMKETRIV